MDDVTMDALKMLTELAIIQIDAEFNGCGDSGQVEEAQITEALHAVETYKTVHLPKWFADKHNDGDQLLIETWLQTWVDNLVMGTDYDWCNNDGGFGTVLIRPGESRIFVDMNINFTESNNYPIELGVVPDEVTEEVDG